jgi:exopolyphosphatase/pppGpp-phosphohydrolase
MATLARLSADEVVTTFGVRPRRARQLAAGVAIVAALLDRFGIDQAEASEASLRDGAIVAALARGDAWRAALPDLIR